MRTTITLDPALLRSAKRLASERNTTLSEVIADALRAQLAAKPARATRPFKLITFRGDGPRPGINLDRTSEILEHEDVERYGQDPRRARR